VMLPPLLDGMQRNRLDLSPVIAERQFR